jgi:Lrp/AsnC family transcriptional regulator for asnA, asnC and gidA
MSAETPTDTRERAGRTRDELDDLDREIVEVLRLDGRTSNREIARRLGIAEGTVRSRIKRLEDQGLMRIVAVTDIFAAGKNVYATVGLTVDKRRIYAVCSELEKIEEVTFVSVAFGLYDVVAVLLMESRTRMLDILSTQIATIPGVRRTETADGLEILKYTITVARIPRR